jgi:hypothetical protein
MRDRKIMAVYVLGTLSIVGGIVAYNNADDDLPGGGPDNGPSRRVEKGQGIAIDLAIPEPFGSREQPDTSAPARRTVTPPATQAPRSAARGLASAPAARPVSVSARPACAQSLLGSVIGLLGALLGGGGGC